MTSRTLCILTLALLVTACGDGIGGGPNRLEIVSRTLQPADEALAAIYNRSCRSCHTIAATGSPLTGDGEAWAQRYTKGMPALVDNVINGYGGMPALGLCMDCSGDEFEALIDFMATPAQAQQ